MAWTTTAIKAKIKNLIGDSGADDAELLILINHFYQNVLPLEFHLKALEDTMIVTCIDGIDSYDIDPDSYLSVNGPAWIDDLGTSELYQIPFRQDSTAFWTEYPEPTAAGSYDKNLPESVLYWHQTIYPRPCPDDAYLIGIESYKKPTALGSGDSPMEDLWGPILAYDTAIDILFDRQDTDPIEGILAARKISAGKISRKELMQFENVRSVGRW